MRNLWMILKNDCNESLGLSALAHERGTSRKWASFLKVLVELLMVICVFWAFHALGRGIAKVGFADAIPLFGYTIGTILSLVITILKINESLAGKTDAEFLMAMPLSNFVQVLVIFLRLYLWNMLFVLLSNIPMIMSYVDVRHPDATFWVLWIIGLLLTSLPVTGVAALVGTFLALILSSVKNSNMIHSIITLSVFVAVSAVVLNIGNGFGKVLGNGQNVEHMISVIVGNYKLGYFYQHGIMGRETGWLFLFILISVIWNLLFVFFMSMSYEEVILALRAPKFYRSFSYGTQTQTEMQKSLFKKELQQWLHSRSYMLSTLMGVLFAVIFSVFFLIKGPQDLFAEYGVMKYYDTIKNAIPFLLATFAAASCTTYCAMSMEGRRHWIMETMPMDETLIKKSKWKLNIVTVLPPIVLSSILLAIAFRVSALQWILYLVVPAAYTIVSAWWGLFIDTRFADYSSESENQILRGNTSFFAGFIPGVVLPLVIMMLIIA